MEIFRSSVLYLFSTGINRGLPFLLLPFLTRYLSNEEYGLLSLSLACISILSIFFGFNPFIYLIAKFHKLTKKQLAKRLKHILYLTFISCLFFGGLLILLSDFFSNYGFVLQIIIFIILVALSRVLMSIGLVIFQMKKKAFEYFLLTLALAIPLFGFILVGIINLNFKWSFVLLAEAIIGMFLGIAIIIFLFNKDYLKGKLKLNTFKEILSFCIPLVPHVLAFTVINAVDRFFLAEMVDIKTVGLYGTAYILGLGLSLFHEALHKAWQPYFFEYLADESDLLKDKMVKMTWLYYVGSMVAYFVFVEIIRLILPILVGEDFLLSMSYVPLIALAYTFAGMYRVVAGYLYHIDKTWLLASLSVSAAIINIILNYYLIPINGGLGAAQATLASFVFLFLSVKIAVVINYDMRWFTFRINNK